MLFGSTVLEVAIGMIFLYLLLSLLCSAISEYIEAKLNNRAKDLERGIRLLLNDPQGNELSRMLYEHPLVKSLYRSKSQLPSYIPSRTFALALWDIAFPATARADGVPGSDQQLKTIREALLKFPNEDVRRSLLTLIDDAGGSFEEARKNVEEWYDSAMNRVSGWYKRRVHVILLIIGLIVSALINADTVSIAKALVQDSALRAAVVASAESAAKSPQPPGTGNTPEQQIRDTRAQLNSLGFPIGWAWNKSIADDPRGRPGDIGGWLLKILGLLLTGMAISQGAPFWFDILNKFMVIRSTVKPNEKSGDQPSKDRPAPSTETKTTKEDEDSKD